LERRRASQRSTTSNRFTAALCRLGLSGLQTLKRCSRAAWPQISRGASFAGRLFVRLFILPAYRLVTFVRLRYARLAVPARSILPFLLANRYLFHCILAVLVIATVGANLAARQAKAQDAGQTSILYEMVAGGGTRAAEEKARPELLVRDTRYAGSSSVLAMPDIDFDYDETLTPSDAAPSVPGTIAANLIPHEPEEPEGPAKKRTETETYVVKEGDSLSEIAKRFGVNIGTILWANDRSDTQYIRPGDELRIPPVSGVLVTVKSGDTLLALANTYGSDVKEIVEINRLDPDQTLSAGMEIMLPGGSPPYTPPPPKADYAPPSAQTFAARPPDASPSFAQAGKLLWPTSGRLITQYYGWRHTGLDIDGDYSSPIYAAHDGVVTTASWNKGGYGLQVVISGDGVMTRYAHASKIFVKNGDRVRRGQVIAMVGTTGRSTGTHLHFEVYINGQRVNPLSYIR
jgi:murein DD-endopeptidase MepM/ murein hydrolase activator NlpD